MRVCFVVCCCGCYGDEVGVVFSCVIVGVIIGRSGIMIFILNKVSIEIRIEFWCWLS